MEQLLLVNPRRRKRRRKSGRRRMPAGLARYWATHRRGRSRTAAANPRRRRRRRSYAAAVNPRRRRRRSHVRRAYRRNPRRMSLGKFSPKGILRNYAQPALIGAGGAVALDVVMGYATPYLPPSLQAGYVGVAVKAAGALAVGYAVGKVLGADKGRIATIGGMTVVAYSAIRGALKSAMPSLPGLAGYADYTPYRVGMGAYMPGPTGTPGIRGLGYVSPAPTLSPRMGAYMPRAPMNVAPNLGDYGDGM